MARRRIDVAVERWPLRQTFVISRGAKTEACVIVVTIYDGPHAGRGEAVPYARFGETPETCLTAIRSIDHAISRADLQQALPPGAARNALDCALWDLEAKTTGRPVAELAGRTGPSGPLQTAYTLSLGSPGDMAQAAKTYSDLTLFKLKLGGEGDAQRMAAVREARPDARLLADANEAWTPAILASLLDAAATAGIEVVEQPLPAGADAALLDIPHSVPICADESAHTTADLDGLKGRYDAVNIKLDKAGGLTEALHMASKARARGLSVMAGCMVSTSLAMAPAVLIAADADWIDLDGPLLLARDRAFGLTIDAAGRVQAPDRRLWG